MGYLPPLSSPHALVADLRAFLSGQGRVRLVAAAFAIGITSLIVTMFIIESRWGILPKGKQIVFVENYSNDRTDAQIIAQQKIDQKSAHAAKDARRRAFQRLDDQMTKAGL